MLHAKDLMEKVGSNPHGGLKTDSDIATGSKESAGRSLVAVSDSWMSHPMPASVGDLGLGACVICTGGGGGVGARGHCRGRGCTSRTLPP